VLLARTIGTTRLAAIRLVLTKTPPCYRNPRKARSPRKAWSSWSPRKPREATAAALRASDAAAMQALPARTSRPARPSWTKIAGICRRFRHSRPTWLPRNRRCPRRTRTKGTSRTTWPTWSSRFVFCSLVCHLVLLICRSTRTTWTKRAKRTSCSRPTWTRRRCWPTWPARPAWTTWSRW
jgi:hypothetical protein